MLIDTHCHIHELDFFTNQAAQDAYLRALDAGVGKLLCVGTSEASSRRILDFISNRENCFAVIGVHPHDTKDGIDDIERILREGHEKIVGVGEIGLDYFYAHSPREVQIRALEQQLQWAQDYNLPVSFHVREAFDDFWPILANFQNTRGVLHSFTDSIKTLERALDQGLYIGVNGISVFSKTNQAMWDAIPLDRLLLETDAPFLTPPPYRGKVNEPAYVKLVAAHHAERRGITLEEIAHATTANATALFAL